MYNLYKQLQQTRSLDMELLLRLLGTRIYMYTPNGTRLKFPQLLLSQSPCLGWHLMVCVQAAYHVKMR